MPLGCLIDHDPNPDFPIPYELIHQRGSAPVITAHFKPGTRPQGFTSSRDQTVTVQIDFQGFSPQDLGSAHVLVQGIHSLVAKTRPDSLGHASVGAALAANTTYFVTAIAPEVLGSSIVPRNLPPGVTVTEKRFDRGVPPLSGGFHQFDFGDFHGSKNFATEALGLPPFDHLIGAAFFFAVPGSFVDERGTTQPQWELRGGGELRPGKWVPSRAHSFAPASSLNHIRVGDTWNVDISTSAFGADAALNIGKTNTELDLFDVNGDRLPDSVTMDGVRYNAGEVGPGQGSFGSRIAVAMGFDHLREVEHQTARLGFRLGLSGSGGSQVRNFTDSRGETKQHISTKFSVGQSYGLSATKVDFADINGDGLPDRVYRDGGTFRVRLNLGYRFTDEVAWSVANWAPADFRLPSNTPFQNVFDTIVGFTENNIPNVIRVQDTGASNVGAGLGGPVSGGAGMSYTMTRTLVDLVDLHGDGLPDVVMRVPGATNAQGHAILRVRMNQGSHFGPATEWPIPPWAPEDLGGGRFYDPLGSADALTFRRHKSSNKNLGFRYCFLLCLGASGFYSQGWGEATLALQDIDGDGLVDHVLKREGSAVVRAKLNQLGPANLLTRIERPLGGVIELDYRRQGNRVDRTAGIDMPGNQYTLLAARISDGRGNRYTDTFEYGQSGHYDRAERVAYGYRTLVNVRLDDGSQVETTFFNQDFYRRGLPRKTVERVGGAGTLALREQAVTRREPPVLPVREGIFFPAETERRFLVREGPDRAPPVADFAGGMRERVEQRQFDAYGDLTELTLLGEPGEPSDDLVYTISYQRSSSPYFSRAASVVGDGVASGTRLRQRSATYDLRGVLETVTDVIYGGKKLDGTAYSGDPATTTFGFDDFGNVQRVTDPSDYVITLGYDNTLKTYQTSSSDSFGYRSLSVPDYRFGAVAATTDSNRHTVTFAFDAYGRLTTVTDPRASADQTTTITFAYSQQPGQELTCPDLGPGAFCPAWAKTLHRDELLTRAGIERDPLVTVTLVDGLDRVIQTKKDLARDPGTGAPPVVGMTVSGHVRFDARGRIHQQGQPTFQTLGVPSHLPGQTGVADATDFVAAEPLRPTVFAYDTLGRQTQMTEPGGNITRSFYSIGLLDGATWQTTRIEDPQGQSRISFRDVDDSIVAVRERNEIRGVDTPFVTRYAYNPVDELVRVTDAAGHVTRATYDSRGLMVATDSPDMGLTEYRFDVAGNLVAKETAALRARRQLIHYQYDYNRLKRIVYPDIDDVVYTYGTPTEAGAAHFNVAGQVKQETSEAGAKTFGYDELGNVAQQQTRFARIRDPNRGAYESFLEYEFDSFGRLLALQFPGCGHEVARYDYDAGGLVRSVCGTLTLPPGASSDLPTEFAYVDHIGYDEFEQRVRIVYGNGIETTYRYDPNLRRLERLDSQHLTPELIEDGRGPKNFQRLRYGYDLVGNITQLTNEVVLEPSLDDEITVGPTDQTFAYDSLYQLTHAEGTFQFGPDELSRYTLDLEYDKIHNIIRKNQRVAIMDGVAGGPLKFLYDLPETTYDAHYTYGGSRPHAPSALTETSPAYGSDTFTRAFTYDEDGNQTEARLSKGSPPDIQWRRKVTWTAEGRVRQVEIDSLVKGQMRYDGAGTRLVHATDEEEIAYLGQNLTIVDGERVTKHIFIGDSRVVSKPALVDSSGSGTPTYFHSDHIGSAHFLSNRLQELNQHVEYLPAGEIWATERDSLALDRPAYLFTGKEFDQATKLYYFGARYYDPRLSLWLSSDPILASYIQGSPNSGVFQPANLALYSYARQNPLRFRDPTGKFVNILVGVVGGGLVGGVIGGLVETGIQLYDTIQTGQSQFDARGIWGGIAGGATAGAMMGSVVGSAGLTLATGSLAMGLSTAAAGIVQRAVIGEETTLRKVAQDAALGAGLGYVGARVARDIAPRFFRGSPRGRPGKLELGVEAEIPQAAGGGRVIDPKTLVRPPGMGNPEFGRVIGWTRGGTLEQNLARTQQLIEGLPGRIGALREAGVTKQIAQQWADFYRAEAARVATNPNALPRSLLMQAIADLL